MRLLARVTRNKWRNVALRCLTIQRGLNTEKPLMPRGAYAQEGASLP